MKKIAVVFAVLSSLAAQPAFAMCGCFMPPRPPPTQTVAAAKLTNRASNVVLVHDGDRTVVTMSNDFQGDTTHFGIVIPVPTAITRDQIHVGEKDMLESLTAATGPRLLEYPAIDPCGPMVGMMDGRAVAPSAKASAEGRAGSGGSAASLGVKIDASYTVGEYDIQILSATEPEGLVTWLDDHGYKVPDGASKIFGTYLRQNMRFFVAKVNLKAQSKSGYAYLRPIQIAYESPKFVLPIRLGMLNADGPQELTIHAITKNGRVESTNYRTVKVPTGGGNLPEYVKGDFDGMYRALFRNAERREDYAVLFQEFAGSSSQSVTSPVLRNDGNRGRGAMPMGPPAMISMQPVLSDADLRALGVWWRGQSPAFVTRLHFLYDEEHFPEDLVLQTTSDATPFQAQYSIQDTVKNPSCMSAGQWAQQMEPTREQEAQTLAHLTGWDIDDIRQGTAKSAPVDKPSNKTGNDEPAKKSWYQNLWK